MTFRNSTMLMNVFLYGMTNESNLFSQVFFFRKQFKRVKYPVQQKICRKYSDNKYILFFVAAVKIGPCITHCTRFIYSTSSILRVNYNFRLVYFIGFSSGYLYLWYKIIEKSSSQGNSINEECFGLSKFITVCRQTPAVGIQKQ